MKQLNTFPSESTLLSMFPEQTVLNVNAHIHTPYSFSAFTGIPEIFKMAVAEKIVCLGINDFFITDGYESFQEEAFNYGILPLFNIEFIGLLRSEQKAGIRVNDPNNPGRCYFCGKGLDYPHHLDTALKSKLENVIALSQAQVKAMIVKLNSLLSSMNPVFQLDYETIRKQLAKNLVRERHLAKAIRLQVFETHAQDSGRKNFLSVLFGNKPVEASLNDIPALENEIRASLLKAGGRAFVEEDEDTFLSIDEIIEIIRNAGGIPCYPVLLDDKKGNYTEFEKSPSLLHQELKKHKVSCIELIPGRNDAAHLERFVEYFYNKGYVILMGTEHNTPEMMPLTCDTRGNKPLSERMKRIAWEGACVVAAHQYLRAKGGEGYNGEIGPEKDLSDFIRLGNAIIHFRLQNHSL